MGGTQNSGGFRVKAISHQEIGLLWLLSGKESACDAGERGLIPGLGRSPGEGNGHPLHYSGLENFMDSIVHGVAKNWTRLSDLHFTSTSLLGRVVIITAWSKKGVRFGYES